MPKTKSGERPIVDGLSFLPGTSMFHAQLILFRFAPQLLENPYWRPTGKIAERPYTGAGQISHLRVLTEMLQIKFEFHRFSLDALNAFAENRETAICGGGGTSKSTSAALYAFFFWLCAVEETAVLIASTSIDAARRRLWKNFSSFYSEACRLSGGLGDSVMLGNPKPHVRSTPKDMAHGVYVIPVAQGDTQKAIDALKGNHPKRLLIIGDETDAISQAIVDVCANLQIGADIFKTIWLGNLPSSFNPLGVMMCPAPGKSVSEECGKEWISTSGVKCLRFDGEDSPNITDGNKWTGLVRQQDIDEIVRKWGVNSLHYWTMIKGLPAPAGVCNTVLAESMVVRYNCYESVIWRSEFVTSGLLDPAFGGDRCTLRKIQRGIDINGNFRVLYHPPVIIPIDVASKTPAEFQILEFVVPFCLANTISPQEFIGDGTGTGRGAMAVLQREWSPLVNVCEFGGSPSEMVVSEEDMRPANEVYDRKITELYFSFREFVQADMIRGLDAETAKELCQREFEIKAKKISVGTKGELKSHGHASPDLSDNAILGTELLRRKGVFASIQTPVKNKSNDALEREVREQDFDSQETYVEDFEVSEY